MAKSNRRRIGHVNPDTYPHFKVGELVQVIQPTKLSPPMGDFVTVIRKDMDGRGRRMIWVAECPHPIYAYRFRKVPDDEKPGWNW